MYLINAGKAVVAAAWTPASLGSALIGWYKADAGVYTDNGTTLATNGQSVQQWNDQSGHGYHLHQTNAPNKPTYVTGALNGLPVLDSDASSNTQGMGTISYPVSLGGTTLSGFAVVKITANPISNPRILGITSSGGGDVGADAAIILVMLGSLVTVNGYNSGAKSAVTVVSGSWNQLGSIWDTTNNIAYVGNVAGTTVGSTPTFATTVDFEVMENNLGGGAGGSGPTGQMAECIYTNTALSSTDRGNLATYFFNKWGI